MKSPASCVPGHPAVTRIVAEVATQHQLRVSDILGPNRFKAVVRARQEVMWRAVKELGLSLPRVGASLGRDHTTVLHGIRAHEQRQSGTGGGQ